MVVTSTAAARTAVKIVVARVHHPNVVSPLVVAAAIIDIRLAIPPWPVTPVARRRC